MKCVLPPNGSMSMRRAPASGFLWQVAPQPSVALVLPGRQGGDQHQPITRFEHSFATDQKNLLTAKNSDDFEIVLRSFIIKYPDCPADNGTVFSSHASVELLFAGSLDEALIREGRFDVKIRIDLPDQDTRVKILEAQLSRKPWKRFDLQEFARQMPGASECLSAGAPAPQPG